MNIEFKQLRYFLAVAEERHFGHAADRLRISQPGLSKQIKHLEQSMGVDLFSRDRRQVELTRAGEAFVYYAKLAVGIVERGVESTRAAAADGKSGILKLGGGGSALAAFPVAVQAIGEFESRFPDVHVELVPGFAVPAFDALVRRDVDVVLTFTPFVDFAPDIRLQPLGTIEPMIAFTPSHRFAAFDRIPRAELANEVLITWPREINDLFVDHVIQTIFGDRGPQRVIEIADRIEIFVRAAAGEGIALATPAVVELGISGLEFRPIDATASFEYGFVWLETSVSPHVSRFIEVAREVNHTPVTA